MTKPRGKWSSINLLTYCLAYSAWLASLYISVIKAIYGVTAICIFGYGGRFQRGYWLLSRDKKKIREGDAGTEKLNLGRDS